MYVHTIYTLTSIKLLKNTEKLEKLRDDFYYPTKRKILKKVIIFVQITLQIMILL